MSLGTKITVIILLKLSFIIWVKMTYFSDPVNLSTPTAQPAAHLFNLSTTVDEEKNHD